MVGRFHRYVDRDRHFIMTHRDWIPARESRRLKYLLTWPKKDEFVTRLLLTLAALLGTTGVHDALAEAL